MTVPRRSPAVRTRCRTMRGQGLAHDPSLPGKSSDALLDQSTQAQPHEPVVVTGGPPAQLVSGLDAVRSPAPS